MRSLGGYLSFSFNVCGMDENFPLLENITLSFVGTFEYVSESYVHSQLFYAQKLIYPSQIFLAHYPSASKILKRKHVQIFGPGASSQSSPKYRLRFLRLVP